MHARSFLAALFVLSFLSLGYAPFTACDVRYVGPASYRVEWTFPNSTFIHMKVTVTSSSATEPIGWAGVGINPGICTPIVGTCMSGSDLVVFRNGTLETYRRVLADNGQPSPDTVQVVQAVPGSLTGLGTSTAVFEFLKDISGKTNVLTTTGQQTLLMSWKAGGAATNFTQHTYKCYATINWGLTDNTCKDLASGTTECAPGSGTTSPTGTTTKPVATTTKAGTTAPPTTTPGGPTTKPVTNPPTTGSGAVSIAVGLAVIFFSGIALFLLS